MPEFRIIDSEYSTRIKTEFVMPSLAKIPNLDKDLIGEISSMSKFIEELEAGPQDIQGEENVISEEELKISKQIIENLKKEAQQRERNALEKQETLKRLRKEISEREIRQFERIYESYKFQNLGEDSVERQNVSIEGSTYVVNLSDDGSFRIEGTKMRFFLVDSEVNPNEYINLVVEYYHKLKEIENISRITRTQLQTRLTLATGKVTADFELVFDDSEGSEFEGEYKEERILKLSSSSDSNKLKG